MPIRGSSGQHVKLGDVAQIRRGYVEPATIKVRHQGQSVIALGVSMAKGGDIIALGQALREAMVTIVPTLPVGVSLQSVQDQPKAVASSVGEFVRVLIEAVVIVLLVSFVSLGLHKGGRWGWYVDIRPGLVVGITIPLVLAMTFLCMSYFGIGLHKISLGSLIIALGLLVDPEAARQACEAGVGAQLELSLGKAVPIFSGDLSDPPVQGRFTVRAISAGACVLKGPMMRGATIQMGPSACLEIDGILVAVASGKMQMLDRELFRTVGIHPEQMKVLVVKSSNHFRADFTPIASHVLVAKAPGPMAADPGDLPWKKLSPQTRTRP
jgi:hypothetical protein